MMKLALGILLAYVLCSVSAFIESSASVIPIKKKPLERTSIFRNRRWMICSTHHYYCGHSSIPTSRSFAINPESSEYQESIKGNFTVTTTKVSNQKKNIDVNLTSVLTPINLLQACTAGLCVVGRLPVFNGAISFLAGKGLCLAGVAVMGLAWNDTRNTSSTRDDNNSHKKSVLQTTGLYSHVRHPFLAGQWMVLLGAAGCFQKRTPVRYFLAGLYYFVLRKKVEIEEQALEEQFGHEYQVYKVLVKGQLIPHGITSKLSNTE